MPTGLREWCGGLAGIRGRQRIGSPDAWEELGRRTALLTTLLQLRILPELNVKREHLLAPAQNRANLTATGARIGVRGHAHPGRDPALLDALRQQEGLI